MPRTTDTRITRRRLTDATHTGGLRRMYREDIMKMYALFDNKLQPGLERMLNRNQTPGFLRELSDKLDTIADMTVYAESPGVVIRNVTKAYQSGKQRAVSNPRLMRESIIIPSKLSIYDNRAIEDLKTRNYSQIVNTTEKMKTDLLRIMSDDIREGKGTSDMARDISSTIDDISRKRAKVIARTEISYAYNNAISTTYKQAGIDKWQWMAALGFNCCDVCIDNHGEVFDWGDPQPPAHPNCLCTILPVISGEETII